MGQTTEVTTVGKFGLLSPRRDRGGRICGADSLALALFRSEQAIIFGISPWLITPADDLVVTPGRIPAALVRVYNVWGRVQPVVRTRNSARRSFRSHQAWPLSLVLEQLAQPSGITLGLGRTWRWARGRSRPDSQGGSRPRKGDGPGQPPGGRSVVRSWWRRTGNGACRVRASDG